MLIRDDGKSCWKIVDVKSNADDNSELIDDLAHTYRREITAEVAAMW